MYSYQLNGNEQGYWFVIAEQQIWLPNQTIPLGKAADFLLTGARAKMIGQWQEETLWLVEQKKSTDMATGQLVLAHDQTLFQLTARALELAEFYRTHQYCGCCRQKMRQSENEWACRCNHCQRCVYPQIAPAVIVAIRWQDKILLAQHQRHKGSLYTVLAGFVNAGETLEQAVHREINEESQLKVNNLRYYGSQPWPFPHSLMVAFLADYASGQLAIDHNELITAQWFHYEKLPDNLPVQGTIARQLIDETVKLCRQDSQKMTID